MDSSLSQNHYDELRRAIHFGRANLQDWIVVEELAKPPLKSLPVDKFANVLCKDGEQANDDAVRVLRRELIAIYDNAATYRLEAKAAKSRLNCGRKALSLLTKALTSLDDACPPMQRGLQSAFGSPADDIKGLNESKPLDALCRQISLAIVPHVMNLERLVQLEDAKQPGGRKERLRVLVDFLADWWISETGKSVAPYVVANRRDGAPAIVHERRGEFISLAVALFGEIDRFKESEIISAVTNMHKDRLPSKKL